MLEYPAISYSIISVKYNFSDLFSLIVCEIMMWEFFVSERTYFV